MKFMYRIPNSVFTRFIRKFKRCQPTGFSLISVSLLMGIIMTVSLSLLNYVYSSHKAAMGYQQSISALNLADAGINKALYCLNALDGDSCGGTFGNGYVGENQVPMTVGKYTVLVSGGDKKKTITAIGLSEAGVTEIAKVEVSTSALTEDFDFDFALVVGDGGMSISNNAEVRSGPVHSASDINCGNNAVLDGPVYVSKSNGLIDNCDLNGDAHADRVTNSDLGGHDVFYKTTNSKNKAVGAAYANQPTPAPEPMPAIDLDFWHAQAESGGVYSGSLTYPNNAIEDLGPIKITGDLIVSNNALITVKGPIWVQGNLEVSNNARLELDQSFGVNSSIVTVDGTININNNGVIEGSGHAKSFILMDTTSTASPAIDISNNATGAIFVAPNGHISISNNAAITAAAGDSVDLANNCVIDFSTAYHDASDIIISSGEAGGGPWIQTLRTWREAR